MKSIRCAVGWHLWTWKYVGGTALSLSSPPPAHAKCERCGKLYGEIDHVKRMNIEAEALNEKVDKLDDFINLNPKFHELDALDQKMLIDQYDAMGLYLAILDSRIAKVEAVP